MTVHQSKGLEFDAVVLCELETALVPTNRSPVLVRKASALAPIDFVSRNAPAAERALLPELAEMAEMAEERELSQSLALLYVAVTRPVHALHVVIAPIPAKSKAGSRTFATFLRHGLAPGKDAQAGEVLYRLGQSPLDAASEG
jgi:ATP-dependent exoDNAse (exonuclease V) beta subunit